MDNDWTKTQYPHANEDYRIMVKNKVHEIKYYMRDVLPISQLLDLREFLNDVIEEEKIMDNFDLGGKSAFIIERGNTPLEQEGLGFILGKFDSPTFSDKPYFTIFYSENENDISFSNGHYDLDLTTAVNDFNRRTGK